MKKSLILLLSIFVGQLFAHTGDLDMKNVQAWTYQSNGKSVLGTFYYHKDGYIFIHTIDGGVAKIKQTELSVESRKIAAQKIAQVDKINEQINKKHLRNLAIQNEQIPNHFLWNPITFGIIILTFLFLLYLMKLKHPVLVPILGLLLVSSIFSFGNGNVQKRALSTRPTFMDSAFSYYKPTINTRWDNQYFYVESNGIADHEMMIGITSWQQQVPIPQCYIGTNAWSIPLNPVVASTPVPVNNQHFLRGAVAIAVNGIAIFNPYTNTGVDAFLDGQLDQYGGHSGRADDYHYHIAPVVLYNKIPKTSPIAFALDGFAIYGDLEPDGTAMKTLDANHGHYETNGLYHYHASNSAPYMIGKMVGKVTEDTTLQIIPQAAAKGVRPALTPLKGAAITHCHKYSNGMGYVLTYTNGAQKDTVDYSWTTLGKYTYVFKVNGTTTTNNYNGAKPCAVPQTSNTNSVNIPQIEVFPNPVSDQITINYPANLILSSQNKVAIISMNGQLNQVYNGTPKVLNVNNIPHGMYFLVFDFEGQKIVKKFIIQ